MTTFIEPSPSAPETGGESPTAAPASASESRLAGKSPHKPKQGLVHGLLTNTKAMVGASILLVFIALALLAPVLFPGDPSRITDMASLEPSAEHWLGTTAKGQDVMALTVHGSRSSLLVGLTVGFASTFVGILVGLASAYFGKFIDEALSLVTNVFLLLPGRLVRLAAIEVHRSDDHAISDLTCVCFSERCLHSPLPQRSALVRLGWL